MRRVLMHRWTKALILIITLLALGQTSLATTVIIQTDDEMIIKARAIVKGKVVSIVSAFDEEHKSIFTYITLKVDEVLKGQITSRRIVLKEPGGRVGTQGSMVFGIPEFKRGERVLLYLDTWADGSLRVHQMFLGKFSISTDPTTGEQIVSRSGPDSGSLVIASADSPRGAVTDRMELSAYTRMVQERQAATLAQAQDFEAKYYINVPLLKQPSEYQRAWAKSEIEPTFHFWSPPLRWFEADTGQSVVFRTNLDSAPNPQVIDDVVASMNAWSTVPGCSLRVTNGGTTTGCGLFSLDGQNTVSFNNCDGYFQPGSSGILAVASIANYTTSVSIVINGTTFFKALEGNISFNPFSSDAFGNHCQVQEITTHEMGHSLGLHHSWQPSFGGSPTANELAATMYWAAHFDGRCASLRTDDINGISTIYPGSGGGGGPLSITTSSPLSTGTVGTAYSHTVVGTGGSTPYTWSLVSGLGVLPPGLTLNASNGAISGTPTTVGTYGFTVRLTDSTSATVTKALSITVVVASLPYNSQFVSQSVPTSLTPGQQFSVSMQWLNTGTQTWSGPNFYFVTQNPAFNTTWGGTSGYNAVSLVNFVVGSGQQLDATFTVQAPTTPGTYNFQWQIFQDFGVGFFGQLSANVAIQVGTVSTTDNAGFVSQAVPSTMVAGVTYPVSVTMTNNGTSTWAAGSYYLGSQNPAGNSTWGLNRVNLASATAPGSPATFSFNAVAPSSPGTYNFQWRMAKDGGSGSFGSSSTNVPVTVNAPTGAKPAFDLDGDGKSDICYYRGGVWGALKSSQSYSLGSPQFFSWGGANIAPIVADFDGDDKADLAYIVPPSGGQSAAYAILKSTTNYNFGQATFVSAGFPSLGDTPVVGDFDGDGKADPGIWRSSIGVWMIPTSSSNYTSYIFTQWGQSGDKPIVADIDGDGKADIGYYRSGVWAVLKSTQSYSFGSAQFFSWGGPGLQPVVGDFDADNKSDLAYIVAPSGGQSAAYAILRSSTNYSFAQAQFFTAGFPSVGDTPVVGDFDGDGKADPGIWRSSNGVWIIPTSSSNYASHIFLQWGQPGDTQVPNNLSQY